MVLITLISQSRIEIERLQRISRNLKSARHGNILVTLGSNSGAREEESVTASAWVFKAN